MADKVEVEIRNVYYGANGEPVDQIGQTVRLDAEQADRLVRGGAAVYATKADASAAGTPEAPTKRTR